MLSREVIEQCFYSNRVHYICLVTVVTLNYIFIYSYMSSTVDFQRPTVYVLPRARDAVNPGAQNIFFIDVSRSGGSLNAVQACAVESAARSNPEMIVNIIFTSPITNVTILQKLRRLPNVKLSSMRLKKFARRQLMSVLVKHPKLRKNLHLLRILLMMRYGGIFLDFNLLVVRPFGSLPPSWVVRLTNSYLANEAMAISTNTIGAMISKSAMKNFMKEVTKMENDEDTTIHTTVDPTGDTIGESVITTAFKELCSTNYVPEMSIETCHGVQVYDKNHFPLNKEDVSARSHPHGIHLKEAYVLNMKDRKEIKYFDKQLQHLLERFCPNSVEFFGHLAFMQ